MAKPRVSQDEMVWMSALSVLVPAVVLIAALVYVAFYSTGYTLFQKVVVVIVAFVIVAAAESLMWMAWAGRKGLMAWPQRK